MQQYETVRQCGAPFLIERTYSRPNETMTASNSSNGMVYKLIIFSLAFGLLVVSNATEAAGCFIEDFDFALDDC